MKDTFFLFSKCRSFFDGSLSEDLMRKRRQRVSFFFRVTVDVTVSCQSEPCVDSVRCVHPGRGEEARLVRIILKQAVTIAKQARSLARIEREIEVFQDILNTRIVQV